MSPSLSVPSTVAAWPPTVWSELPRCICVFGILRTIVLCYPRSTLPPIHTLPGQNLISPFSPHNLDHLLFHSVQDLPSVGRELQICSVTQFHTLSNSSYIRYCDHEDCSPNPDSSDSFCIYLCSKAYINPTSPLLGWEIILVHDFCRLVEVDVVSNSRNKLNQTVFEYYFPAPLHALILLLSQYLYLPTALCPHWFWILPRDALFPANATATMELAEKSSPKSNLRTSERERNQRTRFLILFQKVWLYVLGDWKL